MVIERPSSILLLFGFLSLQSCVFRLAKASNNLTDQSTLIAFKSKLSPGPNRTVLDGNWSTAINFCQWTGVSCSRRRQRVTALDLSTTGLRGTISPHIGNLSFLVSLDLSNNSFFGFLPHEISRLHRLRILYLAFNELEGNLPPSLHLCQELRYLSIQGNQFSGGVPKELGTLPKLRTLDLSSNDLTGTIPSSVGNISLLEVLNLQSNSLTGGFPSVIFNISSLNVIAVTYNRISGTLPMNICSNCPNLQGLYLSNNEFTGHLPSQISYCRELVIMSLSYNKFDGSIPKGVESLEKLEWLYLAFNNLTGTIPQKLFSISSLKGIFFAKNSLSGNLPLDTEFSCPNLEHLIIHTNKLSGHIPSYLSNCSKLIVVDLNLNLFSGPIPSNLGNLTHLQELYLHENQLTGEDAERETSFLSSLSSCQFLKVLSVSYNPLDIMIPESIGNLSASLEYIFASHCHIKGPIPRGIGSLKELTLLNLGANNLIGNIPSTFGRLNRLQRLYLNDNKIEGFIPKNLCQLRNLGELSLSNNKISGSIPNCFGNLVFLQMLNLSANKLRSSIPLNTWSLQNLLFLDLSRNCLAGYLSPQMKKSVTVEYVDLSWNKITGSIPSVIGAFQSLRYLDLSENSFQGDIPRSFGDLKGLDILNLSYNKLSGTIPKSLEALSLLKCLNVSFNKLSGEIPCGGPFANLTANSFLGNKALCGNPIFEVPHCKRASSKGSSVKQLLVKYFLVGVSSIIISVALVYMLRRRGDSRVQIPSLINPFPALEHRIIPYRELCQATNNFCESNLLGAGGFSSVYRGVLLDGTIVAVKVLDSQLLRACKSFDVECKVLQTTRHRNLVETISTCSNLDFRAIVMKYMPNGSLQKWLYSHNYCLDILQRINIMVDVASALDYLHHAQSEPVVHCDLKPANILLDEDMVAHVSDFGIAKMLVEGKDATQTKTLGTPGYLAPEYGYEGKVSAKGDVYSYGIIVLEMITRKKPTDDMFVGGFTLREWINTSVPDRVMEIVDDGLFRIEDGRDMTAMHTVFLSVVQLGLRCTEDLPNERIDIKDVLRKLHKIKLAVLGNRSMGL